MSGVSSWTEELLLLGTVSRVSFEGRVFAWRNEMFLRYGRSNNLLHDLRISCLPPAQHRIETCSYPKHFCYFKPDAIGKIHACCIEPCEIAVVVCPKCQPTLSI